jgi:hypothetical protein
MLRVFLHVEDRILSWDAKNIEQKDISDDVGYFAKFREVNKRMRPWNKWYYC